MSLALLAAPNSTALLSPLRVKDELGITSSTYDTLLTNLIAQAENLVWNLLGYSGFRGLRRETLRGSRRTELVLRALPVLRIDAATYRGVSVDPATLIIANANAGILTSNQGFDSCGDPSEWQIDYISGWFLQGDVVTGDLNVVALDSSYNSTTGSLPLYVVPGDFIAVTGSLESANNGLKRVLTADVDEITVDAVLVDEDPSPATLGFQTIPAEIERAAFEAVQTWFLARTRNPSISSKTIGPVSISYASGGGAAGPEVARSLATQLSNWRAVW